VFRFKDTSRENEPLALRAADKLIASLRVATFMRSKKTQNDLLAGPVRGRLRVTIHSALYLHYAFDLWVKVWRTKCAQGDVIVVRYADDIPWDFNTERKLTVS
jgi:hypothetical protein